MNLNYKIKPRFGVMLAMSAIMLLPSSGAVLQIVTYSWEEFTYFHILSMAMWAFCGFWIFRYTTRNITISNELIMHRSLWKLIEHRADNISQLAEVHIPTRDKFGAKMFDEYIPYLRIVSSNGTTLERIETISKYDNLKSSLENLSYPKIEKIIREKSLAYKLFDWQF